MSLAERFHALFPSYSKAHGRYRTEGAKKRDRDGKLEGKARTVKGPLTDKLIAGYLAGKGDGVGAIMLRDDDTVSFAVLDIDVYDPAVKLDWAKRLAGKRVIPCESKSGGTHLYFFFAEPLPAPFVFGKMQLVAKQLGVAGCEVFPKQIRRVNGEDQGNWINLPYYGATRAMLKADGTPATLEEFIDYAESHKLSRADLDALEAKPRELFGDAVAILAGIEGPKDHVSRNDAVFEKLVALKQVAPNVNVTMKQARRLAEDVCKARGERGLNDEPLSDAELEQLLKSVNKGKYKAPGELVNPLFVAKYDEDHAIVSAGGKARVLKKHFKGDRRTGYTLMSFEDFRKLHSHEGAAPVDWLQRTTNRFLGGMVFDPSENHADDEFNTWVGGFDADEFEGDFEKARAGCKTILWHIRNVLASGDGGKTVDRECAEYIEKWVAWMFQNPGEPAEVVLVFRGGKGVGKGFLGNLLRSLCAPHSVHIAKSDGITGRFNKHLGESIFVFADEAFASRDKEGNGQLNHLVTNETFQVESKGIDQRTERNRLHIIMASNDDYIVPTSDDERRWAAFDALNIKQRDRAYFKALFRAADEERAAFLAWALQYPLGDWHPRDDIPQTVALQSQKEHTEDPWVSLLRDCLNRGSLPGTCPDYHDQEPNELVSHSFVREMNDRARFKPPAHRAGVFLTKMATKHGWRKDNLGWHFKDLDAEGRPMLVRGIRYVLPKDLAKARKQFDPKGEWDPEVKEWRYHILKASAVEQEAEDDFENSRATDAEIEAISLRFGKVDA